MPGAPLRTNERGSPRVRLISSLAMLVVVAGGVGFYSVRKTNELFDIGVNDHFKCAVEGNPRQSGAAEMADGLGGGFAPMLRPVADATGAEALAARHCTAAGRDDLQIVLKKDGMLLSVIVARRGPDDIFPRAFSGSTVRGDGVELHAGVRNGYAVAAFQSGAWLGYVVSGLPERRNNEIAARIAPVLARFTARSTGP